MKRACLFLSLSLPLLTGCASLELTPIKAAQQKPSNVALYFKVENESGDPVPGLTADKFRIYEDGHLVSQVESKQTILNPDVTAVHYTMLLVDMSGSVTEGGAVDMLVQAVGAFSDRVEKQQKLAIYAFDGTPDLYPIVPFTSQAGSAKAGAQQLAGFKPRDPSTNLNGAIVKALDELDGALGKAPQPLKFGTLVVFTDGGDRATRVPESEMEQHVREKPFDVFAIGLGAEIRKQQLNEIGKSGTATAADKNALVKAFDDMGAKVVASTKSYYLLSYCSPSRAGRHVVRVEAVQNQGKSEATGSLRSDFDATGFSPGCDPNTMPTFDVTKSDALAPPPSSPSGDTDKDAKGKDKKDDKKEDKKSEKKPAKSASPAPPKPPPPPPAAHHDAPPPAPPPAAAPPAKQDFNP